MKYSGGAAAVLLASVVAAAAQTPPPPPVMMTGDLFQGFYLGANLGGGFSNANVSSSSSGTVTNTKLNASGPVGGIQGGYNWRLGPSWIVGVETDFDGTGLSTSNGSYVKSVAGATVTGSASRREEWLGTVRGRIGYNLTPDWLYFVTGGFAYAQIDSSVNGIATGIVVPPLPGTQTTGFRGSTQGVQTGWTVGAGSEVRIAPQWGLTFQYLYTDLGNFSYNAPTRAATVPALVGTRNTVTVDNDSHIFRIGVNYHFGAPPPPLPAPAAMPAPPPAAAKVFIVFFDWDKDIVTREGQAIIQQAADAYRAGAPVQIQVTGYTDRSGSPGYNQRLSERRANNVAKALAALGVPKTQMAVSGRGENDNRVPTAPGVREPQNRRVEIVSP
jgi:outer membrane protein OmpA-like peptidoglycan-associated protein